MTRPLWGIMNVPLPHDMCCDVDCNLIICAYCSVEGIKKTYISCRLADDLIDQRRPQSASGSWRSRLAKVLIAYQAQSFPRSQPRSFQLATCSNARHFVQLQRPPNFYLDSILLFQSSKLLTRNQPSLNHHYTRTSPHSPWSA